MVWLRRGWLWAIACTLIIGGSSALMMRLELLDAEPTLGPELYGHALTLHGLLSLAMLLGAVLAIPTLVVKPGRGAVALGFLALALWAGAIVFLVGLYALGPQEWSGFPRRSVLFVLAASLVVGAAQIAVSLSANADRSSRPQLVAGVAGIVAIAILVSRLVAGELPTANYWLLAITAIACGLIPDATKRRETSFAMFVIAPCLLLAWAATALLHFVRTDYLHDSVAAVSPLPLIGGTLLGALLLAATRLQTPQRPLADVAAVLITVGTSLASVGFFLLGSRGLPRRYFAYLPEFQSLQILVGVSAVIAAIGCVAALVGFRRGTRADA